MTGNEELEYKEWIKNLKVGSKVILAINRFGKPIYWQTKVNNISTVTGRIYVGEHSFSADGTMDKKKGVLYELIMPTSEIGKRIIKDDLKFEVRNLFNDKFSALSTEQLEAIKNVIKNGV